MPESGEVTALLRQWRAGDAHAFDVLVPLVYDQLRRIAAKYMRSENSGHTWSVTGLLHESLVKLMQSESSPEWQDRKHFFVVASRAMRQLLVDHSRRKSAAKRSGGAALDQLQLGPVESPLGPADIIDLDRVLASLQQQEPRRASMLELRYFGGLTIAEIAEILGSSTATVSRELKMTEAWLASQLRAGKGA
ncbi:DNA-directed RNA polymerase sigma-70 factor [Bryobacterales bacterium F-183]|nr:DNA-directed RNA polymerase sigma-70 factor [Bryobacterales bacterium F-183]